MPWWGRRGPPRKAATPCCTYVPYEATDCAVRQGGVAPASTVKTHHEMCARPQHEPHPSSGPAATGTVEHAACCTLAEARCQPRLLGSALSLAAAQSTVGCHCGTPLPRAIHVCDTADRSDRCGTLYRHWLRLYGSSAVGTASSRTRRADVAYQ
jgi:hypothetical protein